jgi:hypothetical protein
MRYTLRTRARNLNSFDEVAAHYASVKPIVSKDHTLQDDIRPVGPRRYKWEAIVKVNDNTYALSDGYYSNLHGRGYPDEFVNAMYPITWTREDGCDYVRIRNGLGNGAFNSRYIFIENYLPVGMSFALWQGKQYIHVHEGVQRYLLPKTTSLIGAWVHDASIGKSTYNAGQDAGEFLKFKVLGDRKYERVSDLIPVKLGHVDRQAKKEVIKDLDAFFEWMLIMAPMVGVGEALHTRWRDANREILAFTFPNDDPSRFSYCDGLNKLSKDMVLDILRDEQHPMRVNTMYALLYDLRELCEGIQSKNEYKRVRTKYMRQMHQFLDLYKTEHV